MKFETRKLLRFFYSKSKYSIFTSVIIIKFTNLGNHLRGDNDLFFEKLHIPETFHKVLCISNQKKYLKYAI